MRIVAVIPTRKGSQRVKSKNTRPFGNTNLLQLKIDVLKRVKGIDQIIVNTDCDISKKIALNNALEVHKRDPYFASSDVSNDIHWRHIAETTDADVILMAQTTSPMVKIKTFEKAINIFLESHNDSINSVSREKLFLWLDGEPINYDINKTPKSQDLPNIVSLNFAITLIKRDVMIDRGNVIGYNPHFLTLEREESLDVDEQIDFDFAEFLYIKNGFEWY